MSALRIAFAGDRDVAVWVLDFLLQQGVRPLALLLSSPAKASHADALAERCSFLQDDHILRGSAFRTDAGMVLLKALDLDYIVAIHFPYVVPEDVLAIPRHGVLNLHPAYLPYNRGWHTPSWALLEETPVGATLHFMDCGIDTGDIVHRKALRVSPADTAHTLYQRLKQTELEAFQEAWPALAAGCFERLPQGSMAGTAHKQRDLLAEEVQRIDLDQVVEAGEFLRRLRALTTDRLDEAAYFEVDGKRYRVQVQIRCEAEDPEVPAQ